MRFTQVWTNLKLVSKMKKCFKLKINRRRSTFVLNVCLQKIFPRKKNRKNCPFWFLTSNFVEESRRLSFVRLSFPRTLCSSRSWCYKTFLEEAYIPSIKNLKKCWFRWLNLHRNVTLFKQNFTLKLFRAFKIAHYCCFSLGGILEFSRFPPKKVL